MAQIFGGDNSYGWASKIIAEHLDSNGMPDYSGWRSVDKGRKTSEEIFNDRVGSLGSYLQDSNTNYNDPRYTYNHGLYKSGNGFNVFRNFLR